MRHLVLRVLFALLLAPLALGSVVVTYRDAGVTHFPGRIAAAEQLSAGRLPLIHPYASCGEPLAGNPNFGIFFPDTALWLVLPATAAFGIHFALAWVLAWIGARRWARTEGFSPDAAEVAAYVFALSGPFLSAWTFHNAGMALAIGPWALAAAARVAKRAGPPRRDWRAAGELGLTGGLAVLAGEPVVAALVALFAAVRLAAGARGLLLAVASRGAAAALLAALIAAPQLLTTAQAARGSSRDLAGYNFDNATVTSVHPVRALEQASAFPFGRPDLMGAGGFDGHRFFQGRAPYLWTLHLGWIALALAFAFARPWAPGERLAWSAALLGAVLSLGARLPFAEALYGVLSFGGKLRYPVKWWYLVVLATIPIVARAAQDWLAGREPRLARRIAATVLFAALAGLGIWRTYGDTVLLGGVAASAAGTAILLQTLRPLEKRRHATTLALLAALVPLAVATPLFLALFDRPARLETRIEGGRLFERIYAQAHAPQIGEAEPDLASREFFRRGPRELWALTGAGAGIAYAFDRDPDGSYSYWDRIMREATDATPWAERATLLRVAGVSSVVTRDLLAEPFRERAILDPARGVRLYELPGAMPSVRLVGGIVRAPHFNATVDAHRSPEFDPTSTTVLPGKVAAVEGAAGAGRVDVALESPSELIATTEFDRPGVLVWQRSFFPAWRATVDGARARTIAADGHLVGVEIPAGRHQVRIVWPGAPAKIGLALAALGLSGAAVLLAIRR